MLNMLRNSYPYFFISSWILFLSFSTVSACGDAASPCFLISFRPFLSLKCPSQPLLNFNLSSSATPTKSANAFHFWWRISPVSRILSLIAFETQRYIISETSGYSVCQARLTLRSLAPFVCCHFIHHISSSFSQDEINSCLILSIDMGYCGLMGYGVQFPAHWGSGPKNVWDFGGYGLWQAWVMRVPTVYICLKRNTVLYDPKIGPGMSSAKTHTL